MSKGLQTNVMRIEIKNIWIEKSEKCCLWYK